MAHPFLRLLHVPACVLSLLLGLTTGVEAGIVVYDRDGKKAEIGGRIQVQYRRLDPEGGDAADRTFFRRLRPYIAGSLSETWTGKIEFDFGESLDENEVQIKDAYAVYSGFKNVTLTIGNSKTPFAREFLTSSKRLQLVERGFAGDHNFGTPDRQLGLRLDGKTANERFTYGASVGAQHHDPAFQRMDFDTPANNAEDWNEGLLVGGRADLHPLGEVRFAQGDFARRPEFKYAIGGGAFSWTNDDDNNAYTENGATTDTTKVDLDKAWGFEVSGAARGAGVSIDGTYQRIEGDSVDETFTGGLYRDGKAKLDIINLTGGVMLVTARFELVGGYDTLDTDSYQKRWNRTSVGANYFWQRHDLKLQFVYEFNRNVLGVDGAKIDNTFVQFQYAF